MDRLIGETMDLVVGDMTIQDMELSPMPASILRLAQLIAEPNVSAREFEEAIVLDPALSANVLRMANSAWSNPNHEIVNVREAVVRVGAARVVKLTVGARVAPMMAGEMTEYDLAENELWQHSVAAALAAEHLGQFIPMKVPPSSFTAALLHDIGKLFVRRFLERATVEDIIGRMQSGDSCYVDVEKQLLGASHAEVGGAMAREWGFPDELVRAIERHHEPDVDPDPVSDVVHVANAVAKLIGIGLGLEQLHMELSSQVTSRMGLTSNGLEGLCARVHDELTDALEAYRGIS